ncbi:MAG: tripartite tricarboxylate transporter permease [Brevibacterium sp.]|uniref:tripartite tricarboxylate transporter permease n=1 Tax=Brevibacterium sp. TaxID=1701 RepID=UPI00264A1A98|nr:tripartite tricarboxylate transporter permease [Brevibacterium sp.]MDN5808093.1 tripartite tricarboxylate transporter permease [Brevibacterium sp.]MDN5834518.1 tripartite tricarboxylate transporter permease [Brevibacterium sp.]MDN5877208.1 tripartite tricarboxylate transporter permease [Brevibacterium sp.]MDN5910009.1 tripartite tricarboxylate transporter permease [Brevibacterium sp.]MDN6124311.1 tripartite tricarboxylate transporter permease [Brevibacterium sp.]
MSADLLEPILWAIGMALLAAVLFTGIGLISGTDETAIVAPLALLVILIGVPPAGVIAFFLAAIIAKHISHAVPTTLLGIPGDTTAVPMLREAQLLRSLGVPHIALQKAISGGVISVIIAIPLSILFAWVLTPFAEAIGAAAPWIFIAAAVLVAYTSKGKLAAVVALIPFVLIIVGLQAFILEQKDATFTTSFFLGIATGPLIYDLFSALSPTGRRSMTQAGKREFDLAPDVRPAGGAKLPNPFTVLDRQQLAYTGGSAVITSATFVFSPVAMAVLMGEIAGSRIKNGFHRLTTVVSVRNGTTESTYIAETLIPLIAIGLPLSPMAAGPAAPLFNAPPVYTLDAETGETNNLHDLLSTGEFALFSVIAAVIAILVAYPFVMRNAHRAATWVMKSVSHEAIIAGFVALICVICLYEGGLLALGVTITVGLIGGLFNRMIGMHAGVQFMGYYVAVLTVPAILAL